MMNSRNRRSNNCGLGDEGERFSLTVPKKQVQAAKKRAPKLTATHDAVNHVHTRTKHRTFVQRSTVINVILHDRYVHV